MRRGTSYRLSGEILNLKCVSNLLSSISDPDQGLELENLNRSASYGCLCCKNPGSMHPVDIFVDPSQVSPSACLCLWSAHVPDGQKPYQQSRWNLSVAYSKEDLVKG